MEAKHLLPRLIDEIGLLTQILAYRPTHVAEIGLPPICEAVAPVKAIDIETNIAPGSFYRATQTAGFTPFGPGGVPARCRNTGLRAFAGFRLP